MKDIWPVKRCVEVSKLTAGAEPSNQLDDQPSGSAALHLTATSSSYVGPFSI